MTNKIILAGIPRSGTTWVGRILGMAPNTNFYHEPDNEKNWATAYAFKRKLHRYPYISGKEVSPNYFRLWEQIFQEKHMPPFLDNLFRMFLVPRNERLEKEIGGKCGHLLTSDLYRFTKPKKNISNLFALMLTLPHCLSFLAKFTARNRVPTAENMVIKSVHCLLSLGWIEQCFQPKILIVKRNPLNLLASYLKMRLPDSNRNIFHQKKLVADYFSSIAPEAINLSRNGTPIQQMAVQIAAFHYFLERVHLEHPNWLLVSHESICKDPLSSFRKIYAELNLKWCQQVSAFIRETNSPGKGFSIKRVTKNELNKWKSILTAEQAKTMMYCYNLFGLDEKIDD